MRLSGSQSVRFARIEPAAAEQAPMPTAIGLQLRPEQAERMTERIFIDKMDAQFSLHVPDYGELDEREREAFLHACVHAAQSKGLVSEHGIVAYALAAWWLGIGFEQTSRHLMVLLESGYPEVRKVQALNEWVQSVLGDPDDIDRANEALKQAFYGSQVFGQAHRRG